MKGRRLWGGIVKLLIDKDLLERTKDMGFVGVSSNRGGNKDVEGELLCWDGDGQSAVSYPEI